MMTPLFKTPGPPLVCSPPPLINPRIHESTFNLQTMDITILLSAYPILSTLACNLSKPDLTNLSQTSHTCRENIRPTRACWENLVSRARPIICRYREAQAHYHAFAVELCALEVKPCVVCAGAVCKV
jgi:hypothetical protein